jgi:MFS superfamily sulfate permease-like transporter
MSPSSASQMSGRSCIPHDYIKGLKQNWRADLTSGLLVSLIALPLCLGIAMASGFPAFGGIVTAIVGGLIVGPLCGSQLSIKGPAAGLIAIAIASVEALGAGNSFDGYRYTLAVLVIAAGLQIVFALCKLGRFGDFFPASVVHGMLAAIGIIIFSKQIHPLLGVKPLAKEPIPLLLEIPHSLVVMNPTVALVGITSVILVVLANTVLGRIARYCPGPLLAVLAGIGFCLFFDFSHPHNYTWYSMSYPLNEGYLVNLPHNFLAGVTFPDFSKLLSAESLQFVIMFALIGSIESLLTVKAVDAIDPFKRKANLNRDLLATGFGNLVCAFVGGLPMISEVVRSYANTSYGARTRWSNFFHGAFLLFYSVILVGVIHLIPLAALAGVLCVTGYRLASPKNFKQTREIGIEQLVVFATTIVVTLLTDLLVGVFAGMIAQYVACLLMGAPFGALFNRVQPVVVQGDGSSLLRLPTVCYFGNVIGFKREMAQLGSQQVVLDFAGTVMVDHTFMKEVRTLEREAAEGGTSLTIRGLQKLVPVSHNDAASRRIVAPTVSNRLLARG